MGKGRYGIAAPTGAETDNLSTGKGATTKDLNFKVPPEFHLEFKTAAVVSGLKMNELLVECFQVWKNQRKEV